MEHNSREKNYDPTIMDKCFGYRDGENVHDAFVSIFCNNNLTEKQANSLEIIMCYLAPVASKEKIKKVMKLKQCLEDKAIKIIKDELPPHDPRSILTEMQKKCLLYYHFGNATFEEVGNQFGISRKTVYHHIYRAIKNIRKHLGVDKGELFNKKEEIE